MPNEDRMDPKHRRMIEALIPCMHLMAPGFETDFLESMKKAAENGWSIGEKGPKRPNKLAELYAKYAVPGTVGKESDNSNKEPIVKGGVSAKYTPEGWVVSIEGTELPSHISRHEAEIVVAFLANTRNAPIDTPPENKSTTPAEAPAF